MKQLMLTILSIATLSSCDSGLVLAQTNGSNHSGGNTSSYFNGHTRNGCSIWSSNCSKVVEPKPLTVKAVDQQLHKESEVTVVLPPTTKLIPPVSIEKPKPVYNGSKAPRARG